MKPSRTLVLGALSWVLVVAVGSTLVWTVISRAGDGVVSSSSPVVGATSSPGAEPSSPGPEPSSQSPSGPSAPSAQSNSPTTPAPVRRTWQGVGGVVVAECLGPQISLVSAQADLGFVAEAKETGPERLRIEFDGREDESGSHSEVLAVCVAGVPQFENATSTDD